MTSPTSPFLALGSAQFGLDYGVTNNSGRVSPFQVKKIIDHASLCNFQFIDTAQAYGDSEKVLGSTLPVNNSFSIISKLPPVDTLVSRDIPLTQTLERSFHQSLHHLRATHLDSFLLHRASDLRSPYAGELIDWLRSLLSRALVKRIGISLYSSEELCSVPLDEFSIVQLPCSLYDQRLINNGTISYLQSLGISIHARSLFLQGLLVTPLSKWPTNTSRQFRFHHSKLESFVLEHDSSLLDVAIAWAKRQTWMEAAVFGVTSLPELTALTSTWFSTDPFCGLSLDSWAWSYDHDLDPRFWNLS